MKLDPTLSIAAITTSLVTLVLFLLLHYRIEPRKEKKRKKSEKFKELYAPLYTIVIAKLDAGALLTRVADGEKIYFGNAGKNNFMTDDYMIEFFLKKSSFASNDLIKEMHAFINNTTQKESSTVEELVVVVLKEYNQLKKELDLKHSEQELETGLPEFVKELRKNN